MVKGSFYAYRVADFVTELHFYDFGFVNTNINKYFLVSKNGTKFEHVIEMTRDCGIM